NGSPRVCWLPKPVTTRKANPANSSSPASGRTKNMVANESPPVAISDWRTTGGNVDPVSTAQVFASRFPLGETTGELAQSTILKWRASRDLELAHHWRGFRCVTAGVLASPTHKKDYPMQIISHHEVLSPAIPRT